MELIEHLLGCDPEPANAEDVDACWAAEVERRRTAVAAGAPRGDTWPVVAKRLRKQLGHRACHAPVTEPGPFLSPG